jgi:UDP-N-acetylglucosamine--N-acetylmuramyl-(pentapeptide) pyrophosphoryl-undecaprenol N-acetylglucosamine transferase
VAEDHQTKNARALVERSAAILVSDANAQKELMSKAFELLRDPAQQGALAVALKAMALPNATTDIVDVCENIAKS